MGENGVRVLLIEDDEDDHFLVKTLLAEVSSNGSPKKYHLEWAPSYEQGMTLLSAGGYDVCLLDYRLGSRDGLELLREAVGRGCDIPIIFLTGQGSDEIDLEALRTGAADYMSKDQLSRQSLERSIRYSMANKQRELAERALRHSESLAAMGRALSTVAHDIKTPLIAIGGLTQMVCRHLESDSEDRKKLDIVLKETARLEKMVQDMLEFSKPLEVEKSLENPCRLVKETLSVVQKAAEDNGILLEANLRECSGVALDTARMKQALINLLMNGVQASPAGTTVRINLHRQGREVIFDVTDCGCGIPFEKRAEIFSPFFTTKKNGTGLGLPIVKKIVDAHNGRLEIRDNPDRGVTFRVALPVFP